jgi:hypothetical protein
VTGLILIGSALCSRDLTQGVHNSFFFSWQGCSSRRTQPHSFFSTAFELTSWTFRGTAFAPA